MSRRWDGDEEDRNEYDDSRDSYDPTEDVPGLVAGPNECGPLPPIEETP